MPDTCCPSQPGLFTTDLRFAGPGYTLMAVMANPLTNEVRRQSHLCSDASRDQC